MAKQLNPPPNDVLRAASDCHGILVTHSVPHVVTGGLAVYLHSNRSNSPRDVDLLVPNEQAGATAIGALLIHGRKYTWDDFRRAVLHPNGVRIDIHWDGKADRHLPFPVSSRIVELEALPVLDLFTLIESKLESDDGSGSKHRDHVLNVIRANGLNNTAGDEVQEKYRDPFLNLIHEVSTEGGSEE